ncbi:MAG: hypothetical protein K8R59_09530 [Thermoanaerobaculales bacterium]|nr:hypothetical protein [Thermoanaerobaculales bacterium]
MTPEEKREAAKAVGRFIRPAGYSETEFRTATTAGLAFWRRNGMIEIQK